MRTWTRNEKLTIAKRNRPSFASGGLLGGSPKAFGQSSSRWAHHSSPWKGKCVHQGDFKNSIKLPEIAGAQFVEERQGVGGDLDLHRLVGKPGWEGFLSPLLPALRPVGGQAVLLHLHPGDGDVPQHLLLCAVAPARRLHHLTEVDGLVVVGTETSLAMNRHVIHRDLT